MAKEAFAATRLLKVASAQRYAGGERRAGRERPSVRERVGLTMYRLPADWGSLARAGIQDRRARPDE